jgi:hypothetical protein
VEKKQLADRDLADDHVSSITGQISACMVPVGPG